MLVERIARLQFGQQKCEIWTKTICNLEKLLRNLEKKYVFSKSTMENRNKIDAS